MSRKLIKKNKFVPKEQLSTVQTPLVRAFPSKEDRERFLNTYNDSSRIRTYNPSNFYSIGPASGPYMSELEYSDAVARYQNQINANRVMSTIGLEEVDPELAIVAPKHAEMATVGLVAPLLGGAAFTVAGLPEIGVPMMAGFGVDYGLKLSTGYDFGLNVAKLGGFTDDLGNPDPTASFVGSFLNPGYNYSLLSAASPRFSLANYRWRLPRGEGVYLRQGTKEIIDDAIHTGVVKPESIRDHSIRTINNWKYYSKIPGDEYDLAYLRGIKWINEHPNATEDEIAEFMVDNGPKLEFTKYFSRNYMFNEGKPFYGDHSGYPYTILGRNRPEISWRRVNHKRHKTIREPYVEGAFNLLGVPTEYMEGYYTELPWNLGYWFRKFPKTTAPAEYTLPAELMPGFAYKGSTLPALGDSNLSNELMPIFRANLVNHYKNLSQYAQDVLHPFVTSGKLESVLKEFKTLPTNVLKEVSDFIRLVNRTNNPSQYSYYTSQALLEKDFPELNKEVLKLKPEELADYRSADAFNFTDSRGRSGAFKEFDRDFLDSPDYTDNFTRNIGHEIEHQFQTHTVPSKRDQDLLNKAYPTNERLYPTGNSKRRVGSGAQLIEKAAVNREIYTGLKQIYMKENPSTLPTPLELLRWIKNKPEEILIKYIKKFGGQYGREYFEQGIDVDAVLKAVFNVPYKHGGKLI